MRPPEKRCVDRRVVAGEDPHRDRRARRVEPAAEHGAVGIDDAHLVPGDGAALDAGDGLGEDPRVAGPDGPDVTGLEGDDGHGVAEQYASQGEEEVAMAWLDRAIATMTTVAEQERTAEHLQGLAELLARRGLAQEAELYLREALHVRRHTRHRSCRPRLGAGGRIPKRRAEAENLSQEQRRNLSANRWPNCARRPG